MGISQITSSVLVFLTGLLPASCHHTSASQKPANEQTVLASSSTNTAAPKSFSINLGDIPLTNYNETCVLFSTGDSCTITPKILDKKTARLTLAFESRNEHGETANLSVRQVVASQGKPVEVSMGNFNLSFIPTVVGEANN